MSNKRILYIGGFELPDKNAAALRVSIIGKLIKIIGFSVSYLGITHSTLFEGKYKKLDSINGLNNDAWNIKYPNGLIEWIRYSSSIKIVKEIIKKYFEKDPVAIIAYNYPCVALFKLKKYCEKNNIALIADCTEWNNYTNGFFFRIIKTFDTFIRMRLIHKSLDGIIIISRLLFEYYNSRMKNVILLPLLFDKPNYKWDSSFAFEHYNIIRLIYAGSPGIGKKDRLDLIINSLSKVKSNSEFQLIIVGITKQQYLVDFKVKSFPTKIKDKIIFTGKLSHIETIKLIQNSNYFIFFRDSNLSNNAGFPTKFVESIACGTPVLTNSTSDLKDYLTNGELGFLLNHKNEIELVNSLKSAIDLSKNKLQYMRSQCLNSNTFRYQNYKDKFELFIEKL